MAKYFEEPVQVQEESPSSLAELEEACHADEEELRHGFRQRIKKEKSRLDMLDSGYWCCVCFQTREQKEEFLSLVGMNDKGQYINGKELARKIGIKMRSADAEFPRVKAPDKEYADMAMLIKKR